MEGPLRLLVMISSPSDYAELDVEQEWSLLTGALAQQQAEGRVVIERLSASMKELRQRLRREEFHVFHFVGHGRYRPDWGKGVLVMEDRHGRSQEVLGDELGSLLNEYDQTRLAVLNACEGARSDDASDPFAGVAQSLIQQGLPAVIAMQFEITDEAAIIFAQELYGAIADGYPLEAALAEARGAIRDEGNQTEWGTPVLYSRAPDGRLFEVTGQDRISEANREAREVAEQKAREVAEQKAREVAEQKAREVAEQKAREEAARKSRERRARLKAEQKAREEAEQKAREEAEQKAREEAEQKAREEADRKAREEAERQARQETVRRRPTSVQAKSEPKPPKAPAPKPPIDVPPERMRLRLVLRDLDNMGITGQPVACIPPLGRQVKVDRLMVKDGDVVAKGQPLLVVKTAETGNERPTVLTSPWPSRIQFLVRAGEKLSADSHIAALDIDVAYALSKPGTTEYHVDLDGAITVLTIDERRGPTLRVRPFSGMSFPVEFHRYITSHKDSQYGQVVGFAEIRPETPISLLHPLGAVHASMKLGSSRDSLMLGTDSLSFDTTGIVRGVKFSGSGHAKFMQLLADRNR